MAYSKRAKETKSIISTSLSHSNWGEIQSEGLKYVRTLVPWNKVELSCFPLA